MKSYLIEFVGTFFLTLAIALASPNWLAVGLVLLALTYIGRHVSGAYYNPVLVVAGWRRGTLAHEKVVPYLLFEVLGSVAALLVVWFAFQVPYAHPLPADVHSYVVLGFEVVVAALFALVFLSLSHAHYLKDSNHVAGLVVGLSFAGLATFGALFNPAVALGSLIVDAVNGGGLDKAGLEYLGVLVLGPLLGGVLAAYAYEFFNSK